jgi:phospholipase C
MRRTLLGLAPAAAALVFAGGCGSHADTDATPPGTDAGTDAAPPGTDAAPIVRVPETEAAAMRTACTFARGALAGETVGEEFPVGADIPINHFIVLMQENRSFDHYFGTMPGVDGIPAGYTNPDAGGAPVAPFHATAYCSDDTDHSWDASHLQYDGGLNDGFVTTNDPLGDRAMGWYDASDLPFYWDLYATFAMSDHHHCSVLGPTWVNRLFFLGGTSFGKTENTFIESDRLAATPYNVYQLLDDAGVDWKIYYNDVPFVLGGYPGFTIQNGGRIVPADSFMADLAAGNLPAVTYVDPSFAKGVLQTDEHPPADIQMGQAWVAEVINAVFASPLWPDVAVIVTYDEHGGFFDHVPPPDACHPGDYPAEVPPGGEPGDFDRLGFRVPLVVVSPFSKAAYVSDRVTDGTSVLRLVEARFDLPALTGRDANAWPLLDLFDFQNPPFMTPPTLDPAVVDPTEMMTCEAMF